MSQPPKFERESWIRSTPEKVWEAITRPEIVDRYYLCPLALVELKPGGRIFYGDAEDPLIRGEILEVEPGKRLVHSFAFAHRSDEAPSSVRYEIAREFGQVRLTLTHDGFVPGSGTFLDVSGGWPQILDSLKSLLETGEPLRFEAEHGEH